MGGSWKPNRGWLLRTKRHSGAEGKQKFETYEQAMAEARAALQAGGYREVWVEEAGVVPRIWRDLEPKKRRNANEDRRHVLSIEEDEKD